MSTFLYRMQKLLLVFSPFSARMFARTSRNGRVTSIYGKKRRKRIDLRR